jgi:ornithine cyclodeaminase/alanine dehydrogenase-like protein (mu-crystallin family)
MRTGAASGVATKFLANADARTVAMIGTGSQARTQLEAIAAVRKIERVRAFGRDAQRREQFAEEMAARLNITVRAVASAEEAVRGADIVVTSTTASEPVVFGAWLKPGAHINAIGANFPEKRELDDETVRRAGAIVVDSLEQSKQESGDLIRAFGDAAARWSSVRELAGIVAGKVAGRAKADEITVFKSNGIAIEDVVVAGRVYELARTRAIGTEVPMWQGDGRLAKGRNV